jgi:hypothetical protein
MSSQKSLRSRGLPLSRQEKGCPLFGSTGRRLHVGCSEAPFRRTTESEESEQSARRKQSRHQLASAVAHSRGTRDKHREEYEESCQDKRQGAASRFRACRR